MITLLGLIAIFACDSNEVSEIEKLPPITHNGQHTFGCIVDGRAFVAKEIPMAYASYQQGLLNIRGCSDDDCIEINVFDPALEEGSYLLPNETTGQTADQARFI